MTEKYEVVKSALMVYEKKCRKENEVEKQAEVELKNA